MPRLTEECVEQWELTLGEPFDYACASLARPVTRADGTHAVLKIQYPHRESDHEADALSAWNGNGAVLLLDYDAERQALLLERCERTALSTEDTATSLNVLIDLLPRLWVQARDPFRPLADEAAWWLESLGDEWERAGRPFERRLLDAATDALRTLSVSQGEAVLLHQDLHTDNVLAARREPWLVIDPKPLAGEREFAVAPIVRSFELEHSRRDVLYRLDRLSAELGLDRERARGWTIGQTIAWSGGSDSISSHVEIARWLLEAA